MIRFNIQLILILLVVYFAYKLFGKKKTWITYYNFICI